MPRGINGKGIEKLKSEAILRITLKILLRYATSLRIATSPLITPHGSTLPLPNFPKFVVFCHNPLKTAIYGFSVGVPVDEKINRELEFTPTRRIPGTLSILKLW